MKDQKQLDDLRKRAVLFLDFITSRSSGSDSSQLLEQFNTLVSSAFDNGDLSKLKAINHEVNRWSSELNQKDTLDFYKLLKTELGEDYPSTYTRNLERIKQKGIRTNEDFELIQDRKNQIFQLEGSAFEIELLNSLLTEFEGKNAP